MRALRRRYHAAGEQAGRAAAGSILAVLFVFVFVPLACPARAEQRIALLVANAAYRTAPLANPLRDAALIAPALAASGFEVIAAHDQDLAAMRGTLSDFARRLTEPETVALFYFAGHAVQIAGQNYLLPVDAEVTSPADVRLQGVRLDEILFAISPGRARLSIAILDACRDNPFPAGTRGGARGLAPVTAPAGTLIAFSTAPGEVALDGDGETSPFAAAFARALAVPGLAIEEVFKQTRRQVIDATGGAQVPWEHSSLTGRFVFKPGPAAGPVLDGWAPRPAPPVARAAPDAAALYRQFLAHEEGRDVPRNPETAADHLLAAYKAGDPEAKAMLFTSYRRLRLETRRAIQRRLTAAGHDPGVADGIFGRATRRALEAYGG